MAPFARRHTGFATPAPILCAWLAASLAIGQTRAESSRLDRLDPLTRSAVTALPAEWQFVSSCEVDEPQRAAIGRRLGCDVTALANAHFKLLGKPVQVNVMQCADADAARRLHGKLLTMKGGNPAACLRLGERVVEFVCRDPNQAVRGALDLGLRPRPETMRYRVTMRLAPVKDCRDYMRWNETFNALNERANGNSPSSSTSLESLLGNFEFSHRLMLRRGEGVEYTLDPPPHGNARPVGGSAEYQFESLPQPDGVPTVLVKANIGTQPTMAESRSGAELDAFVAPTAFWPSDDPDIQRRTNLIVGDKKSARDTVAELLRWLKPNTSIRFGGDVTGSRYGPGKVLEQGYGHCWDFSDLFITMCRAREIPARQVAGWIFGGEGHVWAEVLLDGKWVQVDPTGGGQIDCTPYHIGLVTSEDGRMPFLYLEVPSIQLLNTGN